MEKARVYVQLEYPSDSVGRIATTWPLASVGYQGLGMKWIDNKQGCWQMCKQQVSATHGKPVCNTWKARKKIRSERERKPLTEKWTWRLEAKKIGRGSENGVQDEFGEQFKAKDKDSKRSQHPSSEWSRPPGSTEHGLLFSKGWAVRAPWLGFQYSILWLRPILAGTVPGKTS